MYWFNNFINSIEKVVLGIIFCNYLQLKMYIMLITVLYRTYVLVTCHVVYNLCTGRTGVYVWDVGFVWWCLDTVWWTGCTVHTVCDITKSTGE